MEYTIHVKVRVRKRGEKPVIVKHEGVYEASSKQEATTQALVVAQERCLDLLMRMDQSGPQAQRATLCSG